MIDQFATSVDMGMSWNSYKHLSKLTGRLSEGVSEFVTGKFKGELKAAAKLSGAKHGEAIRAAHVQVTEICEYLDTLDLSLSMSDESIKESAVRRADIVSRLCGSKVEWPAIDPGLKFYPVDWVSLLGASNFIAKKIHVGRDVSVVTGYVESLGIELPASKSDKALKARLCCPEWWERRLRKILLRAGETVSRSYGAVNRAGQVYISDESLKVIEQRWARSEKIMEGLEAVCDETGEAFKMSEVAAKGVSNPDVRAYELMARSSGFEAFAKANKHKAVFYTLTAPSRFHAFGVTGIKNKKYDGSTPRDAQEYLCGVWARVRADAKRSGITTYGLRTVEPHHDGTPHWHLVLFMPAEHEKEFTDIFEDHAKREDKKELFDSFGMPLSRKHKARFYAKHLKMGEMITLKDGRRVMGSATSYILKYVLKNIGGIRQLKDTKPMQIEDCEDLESGQDSQITAPRIRAWASLWGIRQFQQIGGSSVTVWRELRRLRDVELGEDQGFLMALWSAADAGDWCKFCVLLGGCDMPRNSQPVALEKELACNHETGVLKQTKYFEDSEITVGVVASSRRRVQIGFAEFFVSLPSFLLTKLKNWTIQKVNDDGENVSPRSSENNCTEYGLIEGLEGMGLI